MSTTNQQTLAKAGSEGRPPLLEKGSYVPQASRFLRDMYYADIKVMNYIIQGIPNDIYNSVDACQDAQAMWNRVRRLMQDIDLNSHASPSYFRLSQPYYVTHPQSVHDYDDDYQGEIQGDAQGDKLSTIMMILARAITQYFSTLTNNRLRTLSDTRNQTVIQDGRVDIQSKTVGYAWNGHYARDYLKPRVRDSKYLREQMLLAMKDEVGVHLDVDENDSMCMSAYGEDRLEERNASMVMMARIQPTDNESDVEPTYDAEVVNEVNASQINLINRLLLKSDHEQQNHAKLETIKHTSVDDQLDSNIIFDDPYVEAENQRKLNKELKKENALMKRELETEREPPPTGSPTPQNNNVPPSNNNGPAPRTMEELFQPFINGQGGPIAPILIQATDFGLRHHMIQQVQNNYQFHGLPGDDVNRHIDKFLEVTQHMKQNGVSDDALRLSLFSYSLTRHATT
uniref:Reverse transcriptase domain-containing protein n=1 Tax=Tanacetum cinerariifolium TaxID=118510 RepID=A0A6L2KNI3_TANCI|nr:reverse transcriptase domain-containing protein [Tanacetum cinerariifolium]